MLPRVAPLVGALRTRRMGSAPELPNSRLAGLERRFSSSPEFNGRRAFLTPQAILLALDLWSPSATTLAELARCERRREARPSRRQPAVYTPSARLVRSPGTLSSLLPCLSLPWLCFLCLSAVSAPCARAPCAVRVAAGPRLQRRSECSPESPNRSAEDASCRRRHMGRRRDGKEANRRPYGHPRLH
jgi:hypothetical protein